MSHLSESFELPAGWCCEVQNPGQEPSHFVTKPMRHSESRMSIKWVRSYLESCVEHPLSFLYGLELSDTGFFEGAMWPTFDGGSPGELPQSLGRHRPGEVTRGWGWSQTGHRHRWHRSCQCCWWFFLWKVTKPSNFPKGNLKNMTKLLWSS